MYHLPKPYSECTNGSEDNTYRDVYQSLYPVMYNNMVSIFSFQRRAK